MTTAFARKDSPVSVSTSKRSPSLEAATTFSSITLHPNERAWDSPASSIAAPSVRPGSAK